MTATTKIGISAWTEPTLVSSGWYPPGARSAEARLRYYATQFPLVEVDATHYALPSEATARRWVERTPDGFTFNVKAFASHTAHYTDPKRLPRDLRDALPPEVRDKRRAYPKDLGDELQDELARRFGAALAPLRDHGRLGLLLFQFPVWIPSSPAGEQAIRRARAWFPGDRIAIELRNATWMSSPERVDRTLGLLGDLDLIYTCVDEPQGFVSSVPPIVAATSSLSLVRMHGRLTDAWEEPAPAARDRFAYQYAEDELLDWVPKIQALARRTSGVHVIFNNCYSDYAVNNARLLAELYESARGAREAA